MTEVITRRMGSHIIIAFGGFISISEGLIPLCQELNVMAEDSPNLTVQRVTTFQCSLGVRAGVNVLTASSQCGVLVAYVSLTGLCLSCNYCAVSGSLGIHGNR